MPTNNDNQIPSAEEFGHFVSAQIHPLLHRPSFDIAFFDSRGNQNFSSESITFEVGPPGRKKLYTTPAGWTRYGLQVLGKYSDDYWLDPFEDSRNWYRAYCGTGRARSSEFVDRNQFFDQQYAPVDAMASIYANGFRTARVHAYGSGVYCSPNPKFLERGHVGSVPVDTQQGKKYFKCMLQVAVNPDGVTFHYNNEIWVVADPKDIRPYGILIKEA